jgi:hypothetical protein
VPLLDHVVVAERGWVSLREEGELQGLPWGEGTNRRNRATGSVQAAPRARRC